jgi:hypothetical protein
MSTPDSSSSSSSATEEKKQTPREKFQEQLKTSSKQYETDKANVEKEWREYQLNTIKTAVRLCPSPNCLYANAKTTDVIHECKSCRKKFCEHCVNHLQFKNKKICDASNMHFSGAGMSAQGGICGALLAGCILIICAGICEALCAGVIICCNYLWLRWNGGFTRQCAECEQQNNLNLRIQTAVYRPDREKIFLHPLEASKQNECNGDDCCCGDDNYYNRPYGRRRRY